MLFATLINVEVGMRHSICGLGLCMLNHRPWWRYILRGNEYFSSFWWQSRLASIWYWGSRALIQRERKCKLCCLAFPPQHCTWLLSLIMFGGCLEWYAFNLEGWLGVIVLEVHLCPVAGSFTRKRNKYIKN